MGPAKDGPRISAGLEEGYKARGSLVCCDADTAGHSTWAVLGFPSTPAIRPGSGLSDGTGYDLEWAIVFLMISDSPALDSHTGKRSGLAGQMSAQVSVVLQRGIDAPKSFSQEPSGEPMWPWPR